jgi:acyl-CoA thioesterase-1
MFLNGSSATRRTFLSALLNSCLGACLALTTAAAGMSSATAQTAPAEARARPVILVVGDSLSAEYGLPRGTGWVQLLVERLRGSGFDYTVANSSISGETTSGGRTRLPSLLQEHRPRIVIIELGANDGLRGLPLAAMRDNLAAMVRAAQSAKASVLLVGVRVPPNYGRDYAERFAATYGSIAKELRVPLTPFLLDGFAESLDYFQQDRIHPNEAAQSRMLDNVWRELRPMLAGKAVSSR